MTATERRGEIMNLLVSRRSVKARELADTFGVTERTILSDITALSCEYPIETATGPHGGISLKDWFWPSRRVLAPQQRAAIKKAADFLEGEDLQALLSILKQFGTP